MRKIIFLIWIFAPVVLLGQFFDDFSDGDFTHNPTWTGDCDKFIVENGLLRLNDSEAGMAYLATESGVMNDTQWDFWVRIAFTPSNNNHPRIYLTSNTGDLKAPLQGYFLQIGKTGGDNKRLYFYRQDGAETSLLMSGSMNIATGNNNILRVRVLRDDAGFWQFFADPAGGTMFIPQGETFDNTHTVTGWFGIRCTYTVSNSNRFYFDDFRVGEVIPEDPPCVHRIQVVAPNTLDVVFTRIVTGNSAGNTLNYFVDEGPGHPLVAAFDDQHPYKVRLLFADNFEENRLYTIRVSGVQSPDGQMVEPYEGEFVHYVSQRFDIVFNELMVNSRPVVSLPPFDWLELYNTTDLPINIEGWTLQHGTTMRELPAALIPPRSYLVLTTEAAYPYLEAYGNVVAVPGLSANALTIGGAELVLWDIDQELVSFVKYTDKWYRNPSKSSGGWSLEKIDPYNFCQGAENWIASEDPRGGSPGTTNSVRADNPDLSPPRLLRAGFVDSLNVVLWFSEPMDDENLWLANLYEIDHHIGNPLSATPVGPDFSSVHLNLYVPLQKDVIYTVKASEMFADCAGNTLSGNIARLAVPKKAPKGDIIINEVLFNPPYFGSRYVELYNRSGQVFDMSDYLLASKDTVENHLITLQTISNGSYLLFPGDYLVLSADTSAVKRTFLTPDTDAFLELEGMPRMTNAEGIIVLANNSHQIIDKMHYNESMHLPMLTNVKGVALERIHPDRPTADRFNWHSASTSSGFGTPAYRNSQYANYHKADGFEFEIMPKVFAPDGSGSNDLLHIHYALEQPGYVANVRVYDSRGRMVRQIATAELIAISGVFTWDGTTDEGLKAAIGVYVIHLELFNKQGSVRNFKGTAVLAGSF